MDSRPKHKITLTIFDKIIELVAVIVLLFMWVILLLKYKYIPDIIPIHYSFKGEIDGCGSKIQLWVLVLVSTILYLGMTVLNSYPHRFNYLIKITKSNALRQYTQATKILRYIKLIVMAMFAFVMWISIFFQ